MAFKINFRKWSNIAVICIIAISSIEISSAARVENTSSSGQVSCTLDSECKHDGWEFCDQSRKCKHKLIFPLKQ